MSEMFGFWFDLDGNRLRKIEQWELKEAKRLWHKYADIRTGNVDNGKAKRSSGIATDSAKREQA